MCLKLTINNAVERNQKKNVSFAEEAATKIVPFIPLIMKKKRKHCKKYFFYRFYGKNRITTGIEIGKRSLCFDKFHTNSYDIIIIAL